MTDEWTLVHGKSVARVRVSARFSTNAGQLLRQVALDGHGVALLPDWFIAEDLKARRLTHLVPAWASETTHVHALYRTPLRNEQRVRTVLDHLRRSFGDGSWRTAPAPTPKAPRVPRRGS